MKIAVAACENHLQSPVDAHFGRCDWFCIYDIDNNQYEFIENTYRHHAEKAGTDAAQMIIEKGVDKVFAGRFGAKVVEMLRSHNIQMIVISKYMTINEIIEKLKFT